MAKNKCSFEGCSKPIHQYADEPLCERHEAIRKLRKFCPEGTEVYTVLRHVSRSGMQRRIAPFVIATDSNGKTYMQWIGGWASTALGRRLHSDDGIVVNGAGMDMGFELVYSLGRAIHDDGYSLKHHWL